MPECDVPATIIVAEGLIDLATIAGTREPNRPTRTTIEAYQQAPEITEESYVIFCRALVLRSPSLSNLIRFNSRRWPPLNSKMCWSRRRPAVGRPGLPAKKFAGCWPPVSAPGTLLL